MIQHPDQKVLAALNALRGDANFDTVMDWLKDSLAELHATGAVTKDDVLVRWQQGAAQALTDFIGYAERKPR